MSSLKDIMALQISVGLASDSWYLILLVTCAFARAIQGAPSAQAHQLPADVCSSHLGRLKLEPLSISPCAHQPRFGPWQPLRSRSRTCRTRLWSAGSRLNAHALHPVFRERDVRRHKLRIS